MQMQSGPLLSLSPSFNSCSSSKLAEIAARVVEECVADQADGFFTNTESHLIDEKIDSDGVDEDNFEFSFVTRENDYLKTISADEIFYNGQIRPIFPVFGRELSTGSKPPAPVRLPLRNFLIEERRKGSSSSSSSEADDLEGVAPGTYCVWTPKRPAAEVAVERKKSNSTGSSKRWKLKELFGRSFSDGKETVVFLMPSKRYEKVNQKADVAGSGGGCAAAATPNKSRNGVGLFA